MADLKIPNLNMKSDKYIFKKKLSLRRKSKKRLFVEAASMLFLGLLLAYLNFLIPNKNMLLKNLPANLNETFQIIIELFSYVYEIFLVIFIFISSIFIMILFIGSLYRLIKISKRKTRLISYK